MIRSLRTAFAALLAGAAIAASPPAKAETVIIGVVGAVSSTHWPVYIGLTKGYFAAEDLKLDLVFIQSSAALAQQLTAGIHRPGAVDRLGRSDPRHRQRLAHRDRAHISRSPATSPRSLRCSASCSCGSGSRRPRDAAAVFLPPLTNHSSYPLTDSWGLALEIAAFAAAILALDRGLRWLPLWIARDRRCSGSRATARGSRPRGGLVRVPLPLARARDAVRDRRRGGAPGARCSSRRRSGAARAARERLGAVGRHVVGVHRQPLPRRVVELVRANVGFLRRGEWYTALFLVGGVLSLLLLAWRRRPSNPAGDADDARRARARRSLYVLAAPVFSAFRLELVFVPMAAYGLALARIEPSPRRGARSARTSAAAARRPRHPEASDPRRTARCGLNFGPLSARRREAG